MLCGVGSEDLTKLIIWLLFGMHIAVYATVLVVFRHQNHFRLVDFEPKQWGRVDVLLDLIYEELAQFFKLNNPEGV